MTTLKKIWIVCEAEVQGDRDQLANIIHANPPKLELFGRGEKGSVSVRVTGVHHVDFTMPSIMGGGDE